MVNIYTVFYDLLNRYIFGGGITPDSYEHFCVVLVSLFATLLVGLLPFLIIFRVIKIFLR